MLVKYWQANSIWCFIKWRYSLVRVPRQLGFRRFLSTWKISARKKCARLSKVVCRSWTLTFFRSWFYIAYEKCPLELELCPSSRRHLSVFIRSGFHTVFALNGKETVRISVQSHLKVHRWCIVHKQPRIRKLSRPDVSCWTWDQGHHREHHFCFLPRFTPVNWEGWSTSHYYLRQTRWFQFPHYKLPVSELSIFVCLWRVYLSTYTIRPG